MGSYFGISQSGSTASDQLVETYIQTQQYRLTPLNNKKTALENKQSFFNTVNAKLNQLVSALDKFGSYKAVTNDTGTSKVFEKLTKTITGKDGVVQRSTVDDDFVTRKVSTSQDEHVTATANSKAMTGTNTLRVDKLATADTFIGAQLNLSDKFADGGTEPGEQQFSITLGDETKIFKLKVNADDSNETVMKNLVKAINASEDDGGFGGDINAAFVKDTSSTGRLTLTSKDTGEENKISFNDAATVERKINEGEEGETTVSETLPKSSFAQKIGFSAEISSDRSASSGKTVGFKVSDASQLNSIVELNGVKISRGSNTIDDAIDGVTFTIKKAHTAEEAVAALTTEIDTNAVETLVEPLVTAFNSLANYLAISKSNHGNDASMVSLQNSFRNLASTKLVDSDEDGVPKYLAEIGFTMSSDNVLRLTDTDKLKKVLEMDNGAQMVADLFTSKNGFAAKISEAVDSLRAKDNEPGLIKNRLDSINQQIINNNKRITSTTSNIEKMAESTRKQYESYLSIYYNAQNQMTLLQTMGSSSSSSSSSTTTSS